MKLTHEDFLRKLSLKNPNIDPLEQYKGNKINILSRCRVCGYEWMVRPGNLLSGKDCPKSSRVHATAKRTKTQEEFLGDLASRNTNVEPLEAYKGSNRKILFRCKSCSYEWSAKPSHILNGHGCPVCGGSMRKDNEVFRTQLSQINPMIEPLEEYINARKKILCRCGHCKGEWYGTPDKLLQGNGCPICGKRHSTSFPEQAIYYYLRKLYPDTENRYCLPGSRMEIDVFVPSLSIGIEYDGVFWHKAQAEREVKKYLKCKEHGITLYRMRESTEPIEGIADGVILRHRPYSFDTLDSALKELFDKLTVQVPVSTFRDSASIREQFFTDLAHNSLAELYPNVAEEWHPEKNGKITPEMVSYGSNQRYYWKCAVCQREWLAAVADRTVGGKGCSKCAKNMLSQKFKKKHEVFVAQLNAVNPNLEPLEEYRTAHENIMMRCTVCRNEWPAAPANLLRGRDCPICSRKRGYAKMAETKREHFRKLREKKG